jgi:hypothetical protein
MEFTQTSPERRAESHKGKGSKRTDDKRQGLLQGKVRRQKIEGCAVLGALAE